MAAREKRASRDVLYLTSGSSPVATITGAARAEDRNAINAFRHNLATCRRFEEKGRVSPGVGVDSRSRNPKVECDDFHRATNLHVA